jgi:hypothetical protein
MLLFDRSSLEDDNLFSVVIFLVIFSKQARKRYETEIKPNLLHPIRKVSFLAAHYHSCTKSRFYTRKQEAGRQRNHYTQVYYY